MIIDASVAFKWMFLEDLSSNAVDLIARDDLRAPPLLLMEIGDALWKMGKRGELGDKDAYAAQLQQIASLIDIVDATAFIPRALQIAVALDHAIYDCVYVATAEALDDEVVTADMRFLKKIEACGMSLRVRALA